MLIVVHREKGIDASNSAKQLYHILLKSFPNAVKYSYAGKFITIGDIRICFYSGRIQKMAGLRPNYYNVDLRIASEFLTMPALAIGGKELGSLDDIYEVIVDHLNDEKGENK